ncbi:hypothetical protein HXX76_000095 [Chlamydomonas incerta]|uniref:Uncharacterized protein n=1 Tax=Chlamydomonas incerta TaxID=51695 RepID=A0A836B2K9_CHLIN|nr:hypothetical protein HXX76_000095 [Chlamydomonas incerta]|eukprot:KAG2445479.1 hypothetical protein HXX76_000095 [Chlamydomonas incerta]
MLSEGVSLLFGGVRWFWRHRKTAAPQQQQQQQQHNGVGFGNLPGMHPSSASHSHGSQPSSAPGWPHHAGGPAAYGAPHHHGTAQQHHVPHAHHQHQPHPQQQQHAAMRSGDHHAPVMRSVDHHARPAAPMPPSPGRQSQQQTWQAHAPQPQQHQQHQPHPGQAWQPAHTGVPVAAAVHASHSDLTTPDLDFESDLEADARIPAFAAQASPQGVSTNGAMPFAAHGPGAMHQPVHQPPVGQQQQQQQHMPHHAPAQPAAFASHVAHPPAPQAQPQKPQQRPRPVAGTVDAECHIRNWDEPECTTRRGHRPLSELMNNGQ